MWQEAQRSCEASSDPVHNPSSADCLLRDTHYRVVKAISGERTIASVDVLSDKDRLDEIRGCSAVRSSQKKPGNMPGR